MNKIKEKCPNLVYRLLIACCEINKRSCGHYGDFHSCKFYIYKIEKVTKVLNDVIRALSHKESVEGQDLSVNDCIKLLEGCVILLEGSK